MSSQWISAENRLPEDSTIVLIKGGVARYYSSAKAWYSATGLANGRRIRWDVIYWMPLPEPPK